MSLLFDGNTVTTPLHAFGYHRVGMRVPTTILACVLCANLAAEPLSVTRMLGLFERMRQAQVSHQPVSFQLSQQEVDEYLAHSLQLTPRPGLRNFTVKFFP